MIHCSTLSSDNTLDVEVDFDHCIVDNSEHSSTVFDHDNSLGSRPVRNRQPPQRYGDIYVHD